MRSEHTWIQNKDVTRAVFEVIEKYGAMLVVLQLKHKLVKSKVNNSLSPPCLYCPLRGIPANSQDKY